MRITARVSVRFDYVLFPFDVVDFTTTLGALGYAPVTELPPEPAVGPPDSAFAGQGVVAAKEELRVDVSTDRQFFGIAGKRDPLSLTKELSAILDAMKGTLDSSRASFFELQARYRIRGGISPLDAMRQSGRDSGIVRAASKALGQPMDTFAVRLTSDSGGPNSRDYMEVWLQPTATIPGKEAGISVIFRAADFATFSKTVSGLEDRLHSLAADLFRATKK